MYVPIFSDIINGVSSYLDNKQKLKQAKVEGEIEVTKAAAKSVETWEQLHVKGSMTSWKDEFWTIIFAIPLVMGFFPEGKVYVDQGFEALSNMPEWYQYTLVTMVLASFGIRVTGTVKKLIGK